MRERRRSGGERGRRGLRALATGAGAAALLAVGLWVGLTLAEPGSQEASAAPVALEGEGFAVRVPGDFERIDDVEFPLAEAAGAGYVGDIVMGVDSTNWITANSFELEGSADFEDPATRARYEDAIWRLFIELSEPVGGTVSPPFFTREHGHPMLHLSVGYEGPNGEKLNFKAYQILTPDRGYIVATNAEERLWGELAAVGESAVGSLSIDGG